MNRLRLKKRLCILLCTAQLFLGVFFFIGCQLLKTDRNTDNLQVVALLPGSREDRSWNAINYEGILSCMDDSGIEIEILEKVKESEFESVLKEYAQKGYNLIIAAGSQFDDAVSAIAPDYPDTMFCVINGSYTDSSNMAPILPKEYEAGYLAGILAGSLTENGVIGIIAGKPNEPMTNLLNVFENESRSIFEDETDEKLTILQSYANSWTNIELGKNMAEQMIDSGADVLFVYANEVGLGVIEAAEKHGVNVIEFSDNQSDLAPDTVVASIVFDFGPLYSFILENYLSGDLKGKRQYQIGIEEGIFVPVLSGQIDESIREKVESGEKEFLEQGIDLSNWLTES